MQNIQVLVTTLHQDRLGDLQFQTLGREAGFGQNPGDGFEQTFVLELRRRQIDCNLDVRRPVCQDAQPVKHWSYAGRWVITKNQLSRAGGPDVSVPQFYGI